jgi:hypothetical protein
MIPCLPYPAFTSACTGSYINYLPQFKLIGIIYWPPIYVRQWKAHPCPCSILLREKIMCMIESPVCTIKYGGKDLQIHVVLDKKFI